MKGWLLVVEQTQTGYPVVGPTEMVVEFRSENGKRLRVSLRRSGFRFVTLKAAQATGPVPLGYF
jgi:hypothetical protein